MRGKPWPVEQERQLRALVDEGKNVTQISAIMGKTRVAVKAKLFNLGLTLKDATHEKNFSVAAAVAAVSSPVSAPVPASDPVLPSAEIGSAGLSPKKPQLSLQLQAQPGESRLSETLPSIEEALKIMNAAVYAVNQPDLSRSEAARLQKVIQGAKTYMDYYAKYLNYKAIEKELQEVRQELAKEKAQRPN